MSQSGTKVANAFVTVIPTMEGARQKISEAIIPAAQSAGDSGGKELGGKLAGGLSTMKVAVGNMLGNIMTSAVTSAAGAIKDTFSQAFTNFSNYEQLVGGVDTLFKESSGKVQKYASQAFKTAGMSANDYMEQVTGFSAALLNSLGGDTEKAADIADMAMVDMADNANKMGTSMESLQYAYQGFAKGNYTMLDNLKIGYGGTAAEMARLINDTGVMGEGFVATAKNINEVPFDKVIEGIHKVQENMGIAGATAEEAATTIEGSFKMVGASWQNFLTGLADPNANMTELTANLIESIKTAASNALPACGQIVKGLFVGIGQLLEQTGFEGAGEWFANFADNLGNNLQGVVDFIGNNVIPAVRDFFSAVGPYLQAFGDFIGNTVIPALAGLFDWFGRVGQALQTAFGSVVESLMAKLDGHGGRIAELFQNTLSGAPDLLTTIGDAIIAGIGWIAEHGDEVADVIVGIIDVIDDIAPVIEALVTLIQANVEITIGIITGLVDWLQNDPIGQTVMRSLQGIFDVVSNILGMILDITKTIVGTIVGFVTGDFSMMSEGVQGVMTHMGNIVEGVWEILAGTIDRVVRTISEVVTNAFNGMVDFASKVPGRIANFFTELPGKIWEFISGIPDMFARMFSQIHIPTFHVDGSFNLDPAHFSLPSISFYGAGGFPSNGQLFVAGERGTEMVWPEYEPYFSRFGRGMAKYINSEMAGGGGNTYITVDLRDAQLNNDAAIESKTLDLLEEVARKGEMNRG